MAARLLGPAETPYNYFQKSILLFLEKLPDIPYFEDIMRSSIETTCQSHPITKFGRETCENPTQVERAFQGVPHFDSQGEGMTWEIQFRMRLDLLVVYL
ncbi:hypothetical protein AVEN_194676-1 [Araneus ventricosus]|uniref:Uncharacterized protein n=1 Tax=Araneus ventricosus TaxID=182803 RepID=A0A4Y2TLZ5_ARAVE|nr:hypothetical protein AVEN_194676-1 [Araneus ventricosus]